MSVVPRTNPDIEQQLAEFAPSQSPQEPTLDSVATAVAGTANVPVVPQPFVGMLAVDDSDDANDNAARKVANQQRESVTASLATASRVDPNLAAEADKLGKRFGVGQDIALRNIDTLRNRARLEDANVADLVKTDPVLARMLADPAFASQASDDIGVLRILNGIKNEFERLRPPLPSTSGIGLAVAGGPIGILPALNLYAAEAVKHTATTAWDIVGLGFERGKAVAERGDIGAMEMAGLGSPAALDKAEYLQKRMQEIGQLGLVGSAAEMFGQNVANAKIIGTSAVIGALIGSPGGPMGMATGGAYGASTGIVISTAKMEAGNLYLDLRAEGVPDSTAIPAAIIGGTINGFIELIGFKIAAAPFKKLLSEAIKKELTKQLKTATGRAAIKAAGKAYGVQVLAEGLEEGTQETVIITAEEVSKRISGIHSDTTLGQAAERIVESFLYGTMASALLGGIGPGANLIVDLNRAKVASREQVALTALENNKAESKLADRNLPLYLQLLEAQLNGTPLETIYIEAEVLRDVLEKNEVTLAQLEELFPGIGEQFKKAVDTSGDLTIPTAEYVAKLSGTPLGNALRPHIRGSAESMSATEAIKFEAKREATLAQAKQLLAEQQAINENFEMGALQVEQQAFEQVMATGQYSEQEARAIAQLRAASVVVDAVAQGMTPMEWQMKYGKPLSVRGEGVQAPTTPMEQAVRPEVIAQRRSLERMEQQLSDEWHVVEQEWREAKQTRDESANEAEWEAANTRLQDVRDRQRDLEAQLARIQDQLQELPEPPTIFQQPTPREQAARIDTDYLAAVERGDMETAQRMVDEAAANTPNKIDGIGFHYTSRDFTEFDNQAARTQALAEYEAAAERARIDPTVPPPELEALQPGWTTSFGRSYVFPDDAFFFFLDQAPPTTLVQTQNRKLLRVHLYAQKMLDLSKVLSGAEFSAIADWMQREFNTKPTPGHAGFTVSGSVVGGLRRARKDGVTPEQLFAFINDNSAYRRGDVWRKLMTDLGYDAIKFNANSSGTALLEPQRGVGDGKTYTVVAVLNNTQVKLADPVTYDEAGNVVPLSRRFDITSPKVFEQAAKQPEEQATLERLQMQAQRGVRRQARKVELSPVEEAAIATAASEFGESAAEIREAVLNHKKAHPTAQGWAPLEFVKLVVKDPANKGKKGLGLEKLDLQYRQIPYAFHRDKSGAALRPGTAEYQTAVTAISRRMVDEVRAVLRRANAGDQNALRIINQSTWYRAMREALRREFGGLGDLFADLLGATSPNTPVRGNWEFAIDVLRRATRGDFDVLITKWEAWVETIERLETDLRAYVNNEMLAMESRGEKPTQAAIQRKPEYVSKLTALKEARELPDDLLPRQENGKKYGFNGGNVVRAMVGLWRTVREQNTMLGTTAQAPKALNFSGNLIGFRSRATIDVWAARMLQRLAALLRIPSMAETGVAGNMLPDGSTTGQFGFGQDVFAEAAQRIRNDAELNQNPLLAQLNDDDLQALVWFIEKELWTINNWTSVAGEGGSFELEASLAGIGDQEMVTQLRKTIDASVPSAIQAEANRLPAAQQALINWKLDPAKAGWRQRIADLESELAAIPANLTKKEQRERRSEITKRLDAALRKSGFEKIEQSLSDAIKADIKVAQIEEARKAAQAKLISMERRVDRYTAGLSQQQSLDSQGVDYVPTDADQARLADNVRLRAYRADRGELLVAIKSLSTEGRYGSIERSIDLEVIARQGWSPSELWQVILEEARAARQESTFLSRVLRAGETIDPTRHRPGLEIYFRSPIPRSELDALISKLNENGVDFFTVIVDARRSTEAQSGAMSDAVGIRMQYIPEYMQRYGIEDFSGLTEAEIASRVEAKEAEWLSLADKVRRVMPEVSFAGVFWHETRVAFADAYESEINAITTGTTTEDGGLLAGTQWAGQSISEGLAAANRFVESRAARAEPDGGGQVLGGVQEGDRGEFAEPDVRTRFEQAAVGLAQGQARGGTLPTPPVETGLRFDQAPVSPGFYSALAKAVDAIDAKSIAPSGWKERIKGLVNKGEVKQDEVDWSGLTDWLDMQEGKVTKEAVAEFLKNNGVRVERVQFGEERTTINAMETGLGSALIDIEEAGAMTPEVQNAFEEYESELAQGGPLTVQRWERLAELASIINPVLEANSLADLDEYFQDASEAVEDEDTPFAKFEQHTLPGGMNYREVLITLPEIRGVIAETAETLLKQGFRVEQTYDELYDATDAIIYDNKGNRVSTTTRLRGKFSDEDLLRNFAETKRARQQRQVLRGSYASPHWDQPNVLVHFRLNDRVDADGKRVLFVEEIQSDWGQAGRKRGFKGEVPLAPFVETTDGWLNLALKHILLEATQDNYDRVAFVNGKQSADRYDLSKQVQKIEWNEMTDAMRQNYGSPSATKVVTIRPIRGNLIDIPIDARGIAVATGTTGNQFDGKPLDEIVPKEIADQIMAERSGNISGEGLKVGGKGMLEFYDKIVPAAVNKLLKKYGGEKLEMREFKGTTPLTNYDINPRGSRWALVDPYTREQIPNTPLFANGAAAEEWIATQGSSSKQASFSITPEMVKKLESGLPLFQAMPSPGPARGGIDPRTLDIIVRKGADVSTLVHELLHLRIGEYLRMAGSGMATAQVLADLDILFNFMGVEGATAQERLDNYLTMPLEQRRPLEEKATYNFELYVYEGKSPSVELRGVFARLSMWLRRVYKSIRDDLNAIYRREFGTDLPILTPEVRGVFDRMLASEEQIRRQEAVNGMKGLFQSKDEAIAAGMSEAEWAAYQDMQQEATNDAVAQLGAATMRQMQWMSNARARILRDLQKQHAAKRKEVAAEVSAAIKVTPVYRAMTYLRLGRFVDTDGQEADMGKPHRLDIDQVNAMYAGMPESARPDIKALGTGRNGMLEKGGLSPDVVAESFGYSSGDEMIRAMLAAKPMKDAVAERTDEVMMQRYGDMNSPAAVEAEVQKALHNEARARLVAVELRFLAKATQPVRLILEAARQVAADIIDGTVIREVRPNQYMAAEARAARDADRIQRTYEITEPAEELVQRYGSERALALVRAKQAQLYQNQLATAAIEAREYVAKQVKYLRRVLKDENVKRMGAAAADQIAELLKRFEVAEVTLKRLDTRTTMAQYLADQEAAGVVPDIAPEIVDESRRVNYRQMKVSEFRNLVDAVRQIEHIGKNEQKMRLAEERAAFAEKRDEIVTRIREVGKERGLDIDPRTPLTGIGRTVAALRGFAAQHLKAASIARVLDGGKDDGPLWNAIIRTANAAADMETRMRAEASKKLGEILKPVFALGGMGGKGIFFPSIGRSLNREARLAIALNMGNDGNRQRLLDGEGWTLEQLQPVLESLTEAEWLAVQQVWDFIDGYRPEIAAKERRLYGKEPEWVKPVPFTVRTVDGKEVSLQGGYYPIKYDPVASDRVATVDAVEEAKRDLQGAYTAATTRRSFVKARAKEVVDRPILYTLDAAFSGVNDVIHDLAWHEWLISTNRLLRDTQFANAVRETRGPEFLKQLRDWTKDNATGGRGQQVAGEAALSWLRQGISASGLGFNIVSAAMQVTGFNQSIVRVGAKYIGQGIVQVSTSPFESAKMVAEKSAFMAERGRTQFREINEIKNRVRGQTAVARRVTAGTYVLMMTMQRAVDIPTWLGAYQKALDASKDDATAVALADQAVRDSQGSGLISDLAAVERGGPLMKLFTVFYSYMNTVFNMTAVQTMTATSRGKLAADYVMLLVVPVVLGYAIRSAIQPDADDDELDPEALARKLAAEELSYLMGTMVIVREFGGAAQLLTGAEGVRMGYGGPAGLRAVGEVYGLATQAKQLEFDRAFRRSAINTLGAFTGLPSAQINRTIDGIEALIEGEVEGPTAILAPLTGVQR